MAPSRPPLTHFLCIPLITAISKPQLQSSLQHFTAAVTSPATPSTPPIPGKAIRPLSTLHLTLGVMSLQSKDRIDAAVAFLKSLDLKDILRTSTLSPPTNPDSASNPSTSAPISPPLTAPPSSPTPPLTISLLGLHALPTPTSASVLHASPHDPTARLYPFCLALRRAFTDAGFVLPDARPLLLHATIVNTIYAQEKGRRRAGGGHGRGAEGGRFDAREALARWEEWVWAQGVRVERVGICEMGARVLAGREGEEEGVRYLEVAGVELL